MNDKYIQLRDCQLSNLIGRVNALCATEEVIHGATYNRKPTHKLVTAFESSLKEDYIAILEVL